MSFKKLAQTYFSSYNDYIEVYTNKPKYNYDGGQLEEVIRCVEWVSLTFDIGYIRHSNIWLL